MVVLFCKEANFQPTENTFKITPWYRRTSNKAPIASHAVEAFLEACANDMLDPSLRSRIKDNLKPEQRQALKDIVNNFSKYDLRVRKEDKGSRFVVVNDGTDSQQIEQNLNSSVNYLKVWKDPTIDFVSKIETWADRNFQNGYITEDMYKYITNMPKVHPAIPKSLYKTHKKDEAGQILNPCPIRTIITACNTPIYNLSKFIQQVIAHLVGRKNLPLRSSSSYDILKRITEINEDETIILTSESILVFPDIVSMYPSVDVNEAIEITCDLYSNDKGTSKLPVEELKKALHLCQDCNCVKYNKEYYLPKQGIAMGPPHACDVTDIWIGPIARNCNKNTTFEHTGFSIYRDDGFDVLINGISDIDNFKRHLEHIHPNVKWDVKYGREGEYLDMKIWIENGKIHTKVHKKSEPIYLNRSSCHDPSVFKGMYKSIGKRLRLLCSKDSDFIEAAEEYSNALAASGFDFNEAKQSLLTCQDANRKSILNSARNLKHIGKSNAETMGSKNGNGTEQMHKQSIYWITTYDPRMPHQRTLINKNYHILANDYPFSQLYPRKAFVSGSRRLSNLMELLSPTTLKKHMNEVHERHHIKEVHEKMKNVVCDICNYVMSDNFQLQDHIKMVHDKSRHVSCSVCDYSALSEGDLGLHIKDVHKETNNAKASKEDIDSLKPKNWITDTIIDIYTNFVLKNCRLSDEEKNAIKVVPPSVSNHIRNNSNDAEVAQTLMDMHIVDKKMVLFYINNATAYSEGSHWSLLAFFPDENAFHHVDTIYNGNKKPATEMKNKVCSLLNMTNATLIHCQTNLQKNGFDCGIYAIRHMELAIEHFKTGKTHEAYCKLHNSSKVEGMRFKILKNITAPHKHTIKSVDVQSLKNVYEWGSYACSKFYDGKNCDFCSHVETVSHVYSLNFGIHFKIHGVLRHDFTPCNKIRWFIYLIEDTVCMLQYIGSSIDCVKRWRIHKSECNLKNEKNVSHWSFKAFHSWLRGRSKQS